MCNIRAHCIEYVFSLLSRLRMVIHPLIRRGACVANRAPRLAISGLKIALIQMMWVLIEIHTNTYKTKEDKSARADFYDHMFDTICLYYTLCVVHN